MSLYLAKIHYWLYDKILLHERLINSIATLAEERGYSSGNLIIDSYGKFGAPVTGALEDNISLSNIHGWLQERIFSVEKRLAYVVTELLKEEVLAIEELGQIFYENGSEAMNNLGAKVAAPKDVFTLIFDHMLEGMPCDNVNQITESIDDAISWKTTRCLHKSHWEEVAGDILNFYRLRDDWIKGFLSASGSAYDYFRTQDGISTIRRV